MVITLAKEIFSRVEVKYKLNSAQKDLLIDALKEHMEPDKYNIGGKVYTICNIYYDTDNNDIIQASVAKPVYKEKLRLRGYGIPKSNDKVYLEIKKKFKGVVNKRRTSLVLDEARKYIETKEMPEIKPYMNKQVLREIDYFLSIYDVKPALYLAYDRLAFFDKDDKDFRVSFDTNVRTRRYDLDLELGDHGELLIDEDTWLMEVKMNKNLPLWFTNLLSENKIYRCSFSKYGTEYAKMIGKDRVENPDILRSALL